MSTRGTLGMNTPLRREPHRVAPKPKSQDQRALASVVFVFLLTQSPCAQIWAQEQRSCKETSKEPLMNGCWSINWPKSNLEGFRIILKCTNPTVPLLSIYPSKQNTLSCVHILSRKKVHLYYGMLNTGWKESAALYTDPAQYTDWITPILIWFSMNGKLNFQMIYKYTIYVWNKSSTMCALAICL